MEFLDSKTIKLDRELSDLDKEVLDFVKILQKHTDYIIISGYVAILFGRSRTTEDVDFIIPKMDFEQFKLFYQDLLNCGYWSVTVDSTEELFSMLEDKLSVRFAEKDKVLPNMEVKFVRDAFDEFTLNHKIKVITEGGELYTSLIELQIAYKKFVLKSDKDLEDATHLQDAFNISDEKVDKYKLLLKEYGRL